MQVNALIEENGKLASAKLVLYNGLHLEGKMVDLLEKPNSNRKAVAVTRTLDEKKDLRSADIDGGAHDPHVWFDVKLWMKCVAVMIAFKAEIRCWFRLQVRK